MIESQETIPDKAERLFKTQRPFKIAFKDGKEMICEKITKKVIDPNEIPTAHLNVKANGQELEINRDLIADIVDAG